MRTRTLTRSNELALTAHAALVAGLGLDLLGIVTSIVSVGLLTRWPCASMVTSPVSLYSGYDGDVPLYACGLACGIACCHWRLAAFA